MRILFVTGEFPPMQGGVGDCTKEIAQGVAELGADVCVLTSTRAQGESQIRNSKVKILPLVSQWGWSSFRILSRVIRDFAPNILHVQYQTGAFGMHPAIDFAPRLLKSSTTRFVTTFHDLREPYLFPKAGRVRKWVTQELARSSDTVIATNDEDHAQLATWNLKLETLIPIGSNISTTPPAGYDRTAWRGKLNVREDEILVCYFGFLNESKGAETLIRALAPVPNARLLMLGGQIGASDPTNKAYLSKVQALISTLQLTDRVIWTDFTPPEIVTAYFLASDVFAVPYREGASYRHGTLMAALAHGIPIVTTRPRAAAKHLPMELPLPNASSLRVLCDGENCLLVSPDDPRALAAAIQRVFASPELRAKIAAGAYELAQQFTWDKIARQHLDLYGRMANRE